MLLAMLESDDGDVVVGAADALRSYPTEVLSTHVTDAHLDRLEQVAARSKVDAGIIRELLRRVPRGGATGG
jgi:hypothetical protein